MSAEAKPTVRDPASTRQQVLLAGGRPTDILALVTSTEPWSPAVHVATAIAARWGALATGCYVDPSLRMLEGPESEPSVLGLLLDAPIGDIENSDAFRAFARQQGVPHASWVVARTGLARVLRHLGAWHSLSVIERDMVDEHSLTELLGEALLTSRLPALLLPPGWSRPPRFSRVLVAWDGSLEAVRAIHAALPFLLDADRVVLLDGGRRNAEEHGAYAPPFEPFLFLARHHIEPDPICVDLAPGAAGAGILAKATHVGAELLVMGAFGHSRLRERVLGGATRHVLDHMQLPVFLVH